MNKDFLNSAFTFGLFLIIIGLIGRFLDWKQAQTLFYMGVFFEIVALVIFGYNKLKK